MPRPLRNLVLAIANRRRRARRAAQQQRGPYTAAVAPALADAASIEELTESEVNEAMAEIGPVDTQIVRQAGQDGPAGDMQQAPPTVGQQAPQFQSPTRPAMSPAMQPAMPPAMPQQQGQMAPAQQAAQPTAMPGQLPAGGMMRERQDYGFGNPQYIQTFRGGRRGEVTVESSPFVQSRNTPWQSADAEQAAAAVDAQMAARVHDLTGKSKRFDPIAQQRWQQFTADQAKIEAWSRDYMATPAELFDIKSQLFRRYVTGFDWDSHVIPNGGMIGDIVEDGLWLKEKTKDGFKHAGWNYKIPEEQRNELARSLIQPIQLNGKIVGYAIAEEARGKLNVEWLKQDPKAQWDNAMAIQESEASLQSSFQASYGRPATPVEVKQILGRRLGDLGIDVPSNYFDISKDDIHQSVVEWGQYVQQFLPPGQRNVLADPIQAAVFSWQAKGRLRKWIPDGSGAGTEGDAFVITPAIDAAIQQVLGFASPGQPTGPPGAMPGGPPQMPGPGVAPQAPQATQGMPGGPGGPGMPAPQGMPPMPMPGQMRPPPMPPPGMVQQPGVVPPQAAAQQPVPPSQPSMQPQPQPPGASPVPGGPRAPSDASPGAFWQPPQRAIPERPAAPTREEATKARESFAATVFDSFSEVPKEKRDTKWALAFAKMLKQYQHLTLDPKFEELEREAERILRESSGTLSSGASGSW